MTKPNDLGKDPIGKLVLRLALPSMLAQFVNVLYGIVDRMYIGNIPDIGGTALAGTGLCGPIVTLISSFATLVGVGGSPLMAIRMGEGNKKGAEQILANCFVLLLGLSAVLTAAVLAFKTPLLTAFGASEATLPFASDYLTMYTLGTVFAILSVGLNAFIVCQGHSALGMASVLIGAVLNILLDPVFIFALDLGVSGAALATVLSQLVSCVFVLCVLLGKGVAVRITLGGYCGKVMRRVLLFGLSPFIIIATDSVLLILLNAMLKKHGGEQGDMLIACATIVQSYMQLITMPMGGVTGGTQAILSYNYGAKQTARIRQGFRCILLLCAAFTVVMFALSQIVPQSFVRIFTGQTELIDLSVWGIRVFTLGIIPLAFQYTFVDGLTALGIARLAVTLSLLRKLSFMALVVVLPAFYGAQSVFFAEPIVDTVSGVISTTVFLCLIGSLLRRREAMPDDAALYG